jgi:RimJ/RimL family protein N-acetyltransferase
MKDLATWQPRPRPGRFSLEGRFCRLEPLDPATHGDQLFAASMAPGAEQRFRYLFDSPLGRAEFDSWLSRAAASEDPMFHAVINSSTDRCEGRQSLMRITPEHGVIEIGNILWGPAMARSSIATEALYLCARHVFDELGYRRLEWKCDAGNAPSISAAKRFGFIFEGIFRQHMVVKALNRDTAWFAITDNDWPQLRRAFELWLDPANFDRDGRQRMQLAGLRKPAGVE